MAPIPFDKRDDALYPHALAVATAYGPVSVFDGNRTNCTVWNTVDVLRDPKVRLKRP